MVCGYELDAVIKRLEGIKCSDDTLDFCVEFKVTSAFKVNLFFKDDKDLYIKEYLVKHLFVLYYPLSLNVTCYGVVDVEYGLDLLRVGFSLSFEDYVKHICAVFDYYLF